jgi:hypothetical protein
VALNSAALSHIALGRAIARCIRCDPTRPPQEPRERLTGDGPTHQAATLNRRPAGRRYCDPNLAATSAPCKHRDTPQPL